MQTQKAGRRLVLILAVVAAAALVAHQAGLLEPRGRGNAAALAPTSAARMLRDRPGMVVLDIRAPVEHRAGRIPGSVPLDYHSPHFGSVLRGLDREKAYLVCGTADSRSLMATRHMAELGFKEVYDLDGGFRAWAEERLPVEHGDRE